MQEAISAQSLGRLSRLGRILQPQHFFPSELPIQWLPKEDEEEGCRRNDRMSGKRRGDERITVGKENGRCDREDEGEERG